MVVVSSKTSLRPGAAFQSNVGATLAQPSELGRPKETVGAVERNRPVRRFCKKIKLCPSGQRAVDMRSGPVHFVIHAVDKAGALPMRAKFYRDHRVHLDRAGDHGIGVMTAGTLVAPDGETPVGSLFILEAENRAAVDAFTSSDPYQVNGVWQAVDVHYYNKKR
jgi:uncharacterized protein